MFFNNSNDRIESTDPDSFTMSVSIKNNTDSLLKTLNYSTFDVGYINNIKTKYIKDIGSYIIIINSQTSGGANGIFCISRSDKSKPGTVKELIKSNGILDENIDLEWNPFEYPLLKSKLKINNCKNTNMISYYVKVITNF
jgi:hypothetical protein